MDIINTTFDNISHFGPLARTVSDAALFLDTVQGEAPWDIQSLPRCEISIPVPADVKGMRLAYDVDLGFCAIEKGIADNMMVVVEALRDAGAVVDEVDLGWDRGIVDLWYETWAIFMATAYADLTDVPLNENRERMSDGLVSLIEQGQDISAVTARRGEFERTRYWHKLAAVLENHHALLCPTMAVVAPTVETRDSDFGWDDENGLYHPMDLTAQFNYTGQCPALSVPSGFSDGLPTAVQIVARKWDDALALRIGAAIETIMPWAGARPAL